MNLPISNNISDFSRTDSFVVIEFNTSTIRVCRSIKRLSGRVVTHCFSFPLSLDRGQLDSELRANLKKYRLVVTKAVLMLPRDKAISRIWTFPSTDPCEIAQMVRLRICRECMGENKESLFYDFKITGYDREGCAQTLVFLLHRQEIASYAKILEGAGIVIEAVTLNTAGLLGWSNFLDSPEENGKKGNVFFLNADDGSYDFQLFAAGNAVFSRSFHLGTSDYSSGKLSKEIKLSMELCHRQQMGLFSPRRSAIFCVTGPSDRLLGLGVDDIFGEEAKAFDPIKEAEDHLDLKHPVPEFMQVSYAAVLGLALNPDWEGIDLTPKDLKAKWHIRIKKTFAKRVFLLFAVLFYLALFTYGILVMKKIDKLSALRLKVGALSKAEDAILGILYEDHINKDIVKDGHNAEILYKLYKITPEDVYFSSLSVNWDSSLAVAGNARKLDDFTDFVAKLKADGKFDQIKVDFNKGKGSHEQEGVEFRISCVYSK